jgi:hypothetical protein
LSTHLRIGVTSGLFPSGFPTNILYAFVFFQFVLHALPISSSLTWSFQLYLRKSTSYEIPHYTISYSLYLQLPSIFGGRLLHLQPEDAPFRADKGPTKHGTSTHLLYLSCNYINTVIINIFILQRRIDSTYLSEKCNAASHCVTPLTYFRSLYKSADFSTFVKQLPCLTMRQVECTSIHGNILIKLLTPCHLY